MCEGGDTTFVGLRELWGGLQPAVQRRWRRLWMRTGKREAPVHPLVVADPQQEGETSLCFHCGAPFVRDWVLEREGGRFPEDPDAVERVLPAEEVQREITAEIEAAADAEWVATVEWGRGDFAIIHNLSLAHFATPGTQSAEGLRVLHRTTILGDAGATVPRTPDGRRSFIPH